MRKTIYLLALIIAVSGCATPYAPRGFWGQGYTDMKLQDNIFRISFAGNAATEAERAHNFSLLRAAEVTIENGYKYFIVSEGGTKIETSTHTTPLSSNTRGYVDGFGNVSATTTYSGGQTFTYNKPTNSITIQCFRDKPETSNLVYDAEQVRVNLRKQYGLDKKVEKEKLKQEKTNSPKPLQNFGPKI